MAIGAAAEDGSVRFGPFALSARERRLTRDGVPVELGGRALDLLLALAARPGEVVGKHDLIATVWPDVVVEETSLRFHVAAVRRALGEGRDGTRYIATFAGRGYSFVAPVAPAPPHAGAAPSNLPHRLSRVVGRDDDVAALCAKLRAARCVTVVGPGGVGKTTAAIIAGHALAAAGTEVAFVDLGVVATPDLVAAAVASVLRLALPAEDARGLVAHLRERERDLVLVLDTCEHVVGAVAALVAAVLTGAPKVRVLATSREALRLDGEHVHRVDPLASPPDEGDLTLAAVGAFPAAVLFLDRAGAAGMAVAPIDAEAATIARICRKLDGMPLAIEMAAGRAAGHGLAATADLIDRHFAPILSGQRTAPPRQQTLAATLDWSFALLSPCERTVLCRLAVFVGDFSLDAALAVAAASADEHAELFGVLDGLVARSLVATRLAGGIVRYRLLDTTRAYVRAIAVDPAETRATAARHAAYRHRSLDGQGAADLAAIAGIRIALAWCFGPDGDRRLGAELVAAAAPAFRALSLLAEYEGWARRALDELDPDLRGGRCEMVLQGALGVALMFTRGGGDAVRVALERSLAIATEAGGPLDQLQLFGPLHMLHLRTGGFDGALAYAERCAAMAATLSDPAADALARALSGVSHHFAGDLERSAAELSAMPPPGSAASTYLGFEAGLAAAMLARTLWLQGARAAALAQAHAAVADAATTRHPLSLAISLIWAITVFLWEGDLAAAEAHVDRLESCATPHALTPYLAVGRGFRGELATRHGRPDEGVRLLEAALTELHGAPYELLTTPLQIALARSLDAAGRPDAALRLADDTIALVGRNGDKVYLPELLKMKEGILERLPEAGLPRSRSVGPRR